MRRAARSTRPVVRTTLATRLPLPPPQQADPPSRILASPLFDAAWYAETAGCSTVPVEAARHYLRHGARRGLWPHPLFVPHHVAVRAPEAVGDADPLLAYLDQRLFKLSPHPLFDLKGYVRAHPESRRHPSGPLGHYVEHGAARGLAPNPWYTPTPEEPRGLTDWSAARWHEWAARKQLVPRLRTARLPASHDGGPSPTATATSTGPPPRVSVVVESVRGVDTLARTLRTVADQVDVRLEIVVVTDGLVPDLDTRLAPLPDHVSLVVVRHEGSRASTGLNLALEQATGDLVAFVAAGESWEPGRLRRLAAACRGRRGRRLRLDARAPPREAPRVRRGDAALGHPARRDRHRRADPAGAGPRGPRRARRLRRDAARGLGGGLHLPAAQPPRGHPRHLGGRRARRRGGRRGAPARPAGAAGPRPLHGADLERRRLQPLRHRLGAPRAAPGRPRRDLRGDPDPRRLADDPRQRADRAGLRRARGDVPGVHRPGQRLGRGHRADAGLPGGPPRRRAGRARAHQLRLRGRQQPGRRRGPGRHRGVPEQRHQGRPRLALARWSRSSRTPTCRPCSRCCSTPPARSSPPAWSSPTAAACPTPSWPASPSRTPPGSSTSRSPRSPAPRWRCASRTSSPCAASTRCSATAWRTSTSACGWPGSARGAAWSSRPRGSPTWSPARRAASTRW